MEIGIAEDAWHRSRACESGACVEAAHVGDTYALRDSVDPAPFLRLTGPQWHEFLAGIRAGEFDLAGH